MLALLLLLLPLRPRECIRELPIASRTLLSLEKPDWKLELLLLRRPRDVWLDILLESSAASKSELYEYWWSGGRARLPTEAAAAQVLGLSKPWESKAKGEFVDKGPTESWSRDMSMLFTSESRVTSRGESDRSWESRSTRRAP
jgi:hypothetical protein